MKLKLWNGKVFESETDFAADNVAGGAGDGRKVVVVGVKLEQASRELLTWALMKIAQPGDRVIALHVLHASSEEQSSLVSLVKTFDSVLAVYEGFCHLKQVDLKLKVSRGSSIRKHLIHEAKQYDGATVVVGTSKAHHSIRSLVSVAKHCARKLPHNFSVFAVDNGKIVFEKKASASHSAICEKRSCTNTTSSRNLLALTDGKAVVKEVKSNQDCKHGSDKSVTSPRRSTLIKRYFGCAPTSSWADYTCDLETEPCINVRLDSSLALVPYEALEVSSKQEIRMNQQVHEPKQGWAFIRRVFIPKQHHPDKASQRKKSSTRCLSRLQIQHSAMADTDDKQVQCAIEDDQSSNLGGENGAIVPVSAYSSSPPRSPVHGSNFFAEEMKNFHAKYSSMCRLFTYQELLSATCGFHPERLVGKGGHSRVFRGQLSDGKELAVKILTPSENVVKEFVAEIEIITSVSHKNIISLFGFCFEGESPILVYDLLLRGSLEENLHGSKKDATVFCFEERYKVALGVAEALDHLHYGISPPVIHRDIKSSNILLAEDFDPQLADFGLATFSSSASSFSEDCNDVAGTFGYLAPEYFMHGKVTEKIDVYAFGVVLLELLSGRKPIDDRNPKGQASLVIWATPILKEGKLTDLLDASLGSEHDHVVIERMALAATLCIRRAPLLRPRISIVLKLLQGDPDIIKWARQQVSCTSSDLDIFDGESSPKDIQSHLNIAFLDLGDDAQSVSSTEPALSVEDYLKGRWSRSSSFD